jgi:hypothetical protein
VASGVPLPLGAGSGKGDPRSAMRLAAKDRSQPFPCMDKPCGCATAEQCFTTCCCNTPAETLAWARAHRVEPNLLVALERRVAAAGGRHGREQETGRSAGSCCGLKRRPESATCLSQPASAAEASACCSAEQEDLPSPAPPPESPVDDDRGQPPIRTVTLRAMLACGGIVAQWCGCAASLPPPRSTAALPFRIVAAISITDESRATIPAAPESPPPRAS